MGLEVIDSTKRIFRGCASAEIRDSKGDIVPIDDMKRLFPYYLSSGGALTDEHSDRVIGRTLSHNFTAIDGFPAVEILGEIENGTPFYDAVWDGIKTGRKGGLSISGVALGKTQDGRLMMTDLFSIAVCERPANPLAMIDAISVAKSTDAKSEVLISHSKEADSMEQKTATTEVKKEEKPPQAPPEPAPPAEKPPEAKPEVKPEEKPPEVEKQEPDKVMERLQAIEAVVMELRAMLKPPEQVPPPAPEQVQDANPPAAAKAEPANTGIAKSETKAAEVKPAEVKKSADIVETPRPDMAPAGLTVQPSLGQEIAEEARKRGFGKSR